MSIAPSPVSLTSAHELPVPEPVVAPITPAPRALRPLDRGRSFALAAISTGAWLWLRRWYGLGENRGDPHFSFEKIPDGFDSPILRQTAFLFLVIAAAYAAAIVLLRSPATPCRCLARDRYHRPRAGPAVVNVVLYPGRRPRRVQLHDRAQAGLPLSTRIRTSSPSSGIARIPTPPRRSWSTVTLFYGPAWLLATGLPRAGGGVRRRDPHTGSTQDLQPGPDRRHRRRHRAVSPRPPGALAGRHAIRGQPAGAVRGRGKRAQRRAADRVRDHGDAGAAAQIAARRAPAGALGTGQALHRCPGARSSSWLPCGSSGGGSGSA